METQKAEKEARPKDKSNTSPKDIQEGLRGQLCLVSGFLS